MNCKSIEVLLIDKMQESDWFFAVMSTINVLTTSDKIKFYFYSLIFNKKMLDCYYPLKSLFYLKYKLEHNLVAKIFWYFKFRIILLKTKE